MSVRTIAGLAREGGVGVETVRFYQRRGLMPTPDRWSRDGVGGGIRRYGDEDVRRLRFIRSAALDRTIADLEEARAALRRLASACASRDSGPCPIIAAFQGEAA